jgi:hypothetical protein
MGLVRVVASADWGATTLRFRIGIAVAIAAVLAGGQAFADDLAPATPRDGTVLVLGGGTQAPPADGTEAAGTPLWTDLHQLFSDTVFTFGATPMNEDAPADVDPGYNAYAQIGVAGFTIGSRFARWGEPTAPEVENQSFGVGASYSLDAWTVGIDWSRGDYDEIFLDVGSGEAGDVIAFTSSYDLRPGVQINGLVEYSDEEPAASGSPESAFTIGIGTLINF